MIELLDQPITKAQYVNGAVSAPEEIPVVSAEDAPAALRDLITESVDVRINFVRVTHEVTIDMSLLTWGDARKMRQLSGDAENLNDDQAMQIMTELVSKVTGQNADNMPMEVFNQVMAAIMPGMSSKN